MQMRRLRAALCATGALHSCTTGARLSAAAPPPPSVAAPAASGLPQPRMPPLRWLGHWLMQQVRLVRSTPRYNNAPDWFNSAAGQRPILLICARCATIVYLIHPNHLCEVCTSTEIRTA